MDDSLYRIQHALRALLRNLPVRSLAWFMRLVIFPTGLPFHKPTDANEHQVARLLQQPGEVRDRLTRGVYSTQDPHQRIGQLEQALVAAAEAAPIERTLRKARQAGQLSAGDPAAMIDEAISLGILSENDRETLVMAQQLRNKVIQVDAFDSLNETAGEKTKTKAKVSLLDRLGVA